jgi:hypothetical protein
MRMGLIRTVALFNMRGWKYAGLQQGGGGAEWLDRVDAEIVARDLMSIFF